MEACNESAVPQLGSIVQKCYDTICDINKKLELELEVVGKKHYDRDLGFRKWRAEAKKLGDSKLRPRKLAFIGRTGVGKSTAINALLGAPVLSTRADVSGELSTFWPIELIWTDSDRG
jgi:putative ribosome biogenesis GTPase RsgA